MNTKEVHKIVAGIKTSLFKNSNSFSIGMLKSHFKGTGLKFKEHQVYTHGDDVRFIDWKMLAKTNTPYVKTFEEERNVEITIILDCSRGMFMGYEGKSKVEAAVEVVSLLYLLSGMTKDFVQTVICTGTKIIRVQKKNGDAGIVAFVNCLKSEGIINDEGRINYSYISEAGSREEYEQQIVREFYRKRELVILSDFYDFLEVESLRKLVSRKHVHAFRLLTPLDYAENFKYSIKGESFDGKKSGVVDVKLLSKDILSKNPILRVKDLFLEKRYLEDFVKEML